MIAVDELDDVHWMPIQEMRRILDDLEKKYGKRAKITFNAGYNNVECFVHPSKKVKA